MFSQRGIHIQEIEIAKRKEIESANKQIDDFTTQIRDLKKKADSSAALQRNLQACLVEMSLKAITISKEYEKLKSATRKDLDGMKSLMKNSLFGAVILKLKVLLAII